VQLVAALALTNATVIGAPAAGASEAPRSGVAVTAARFGPQAAHAIERLNAILNRPWLTARRYHTRSWPLEMQ
jgi:hypothetical protein